ncbi:MAG: methyltransferase domain-containing protein [Phycisphaerales bacterium]|nr:methyltransferase domain-containing protein [Phycisphaerales bacterium]
MTKYEVRQENIDSAEALGKKDGVPNDIQQNDQHRSVHHAVKHRARHEFDAWAHTYDRSIVQHLLFQPTYRMFMEELYRWRRDDPAPFDLLDIGSGTGTWVAMVAGSPLPSRQLVGLDYSLSMCGVAHGKAQEIDEDAPSFLNGDAEHLPFRDQSFDVVTCSNSFHHYPHQREAVREMRRVLRPGGRLMLIDGFRDNVIGWFLFDVFITAAESTPEAKVCHVSWSDMREYFLDAGFKDVRQRKKNIWAPIFLTVGRA